MINKAIGKRIRQHRLSQGLTQDKLAEKTGVSVIAISNLERGLNYPSFEHFISIANVLNVPSDALLIDVVNNAYLYKETELSERLSKVSHDKRLKILSLVEMMLSQE